MWPRRKERQKECTEASTIQCLSTAPKHFTRLLQSATESFALTPPASGRASLGFYLGRPTWRSLGVCEAAGDTGRRRSNASFGRAKRGSTAPCFQARQQVHRAPLQRSVASVLCGHACASADARIKVRARDWCKAHSVRAPWLMMECCLFGLRSQMSGVKGRQVWKLPPPKKVAWEVGRGTSCAWFATACTAPVPCEGDEGDEVGVAWLRDLPPQRTKNEGKLEMGRSAEWVSAWRAEVVQTGPDWLEMASRQPTRCNLTLFVGKWAHPYPDSG